MYIHDYARTAAPLQMALQGTCLTKAQKRAQKYQRQSNQLPGCCTRQRGIFSKTGQDELIQHHKLQWKCYWTPEIKAVFEEPKDCFQKKVILQLPDLNGHWQVTVHSNIYAFSGTLEQKDGTDNLGPVAFASKKIQDARTKQPDVSSHKTGQLTWHFSDQEMDLGPATQKGQDSVKMVSGQLQDDVSMVSGWRQDHVRMASVSRQDA